MTKLAAVMLACAVAGVATSVVAAVADLIGQTTPDSLWDRSPWVILTILFLMVFAAGWKLFWGLIVDRHSSLMTQVSSLLVKVESKEKENDNLREELSASREENVRLRSRLEKDE